MQSIPIFCHGNPVIVHVLGEPEPIPALPAMWPFFPSFLLDLFPWHLSRAESSKGRSSWVGRVPHSETMQDTQHDCHAQLLPWSRLGRKEHLLIHFLWQNKRWANIPVCTLLCKQSTASNPNSKVPYIKIIQGDLVAFSRSLNENVRGFILRRFLKEKESKKWS